MGSPPGSPAFSYHIPGKKERSLFRDRAGRINGRSAEEGQPIEIVHNWLKRCGTGFGKNCTSHHQQLRNEYIFPLSALQAKFRY